MARGQIMSDGHFKVKVRRPGIHSKNNSSKLKGSKNYVKPYRGQGRI